MKFGVGIGLLNLCHFKRVVYSGFYFGVCVGRERGIYNHIFFCEERTKYVHDCIKNTDVVVVVCERGGVSQDPQNFLILYDIIILFFVMFNHEFTELK